jgi:hypothetical protein
LPSSTTNDPCSHHKHFCQILDAERSSVHCVAPLDVEVGSELTLHCSAEPLILSLLEVVG